MLKVDIDKLVRSALGRSTPAPGKEEVWNNISDILDAGEKPRNKVPVSMLWITALLCISISGGLGYYFGFKNSSSNAAVATVNKSELRSTDNNIASNQSGEVHAAYGSSQSELAIDNKQLATVQPLASIAKENSANAFLNYKNKNSYTGNAFVANSNILSSNRNLNSNSAHITPAASMQAVTNEEPVAYVQANQESTTNNEIRGSYYLHDYYMLNKAYDVSLTNKISPLDLLAGHETSYDLDKKESSRPRPSIASGIIYNFWNNPAYTGNEAKYNFNAQARFVAFEQRYRPGTDYFASFDTKLEKINSGIGVYAIRSISPSLGTNTLGIAYSYKVKMGDNAGLRFGLGGNASNSEPYYASHYENRKEVSNSFLFIPNGEALSSISTRVYGMDAGMWFENKHIVGGLSVKNFNQPIYEEGMQLPAQYIFAAGYKAMIGKNIQVLPWAELHRTSGINQEQASLFIGYRDYFMMGVAYQNLNPATPNGDISLYASAQIMGRLRLFAGYGYSSDKTDIMYSYRILHTGLRYQIR